jgi:hypothetical protein
MGEKVECWQRNRVSIGWLYRGFSMGLAGEEE